MTHLDLFSGIGGFALAAKWAGLETIQFVEIEKFAQQVLTKNFPGIPIHDNIKTFSATGIVSPFLLTGGYPCQPFSQAGKRRGKEDDRHLWPEMLRVIRECRPTWICAENVSGHIKLGLQEVLLDLESEGYDSQVFHIGAVAKDAPHRRMRLWIVAHANGSTNGTDGGEEREEDSLQVINRQEGCGGLSGGTGSNTENVAYSNCQRFSEGSDFGGEIPKEVRGTEHNLGDSTPSEDVANSIGHGLNRSRSESFQRRELGYSISGISSESCGEDVPNSKGKRVEGCRSGGEQESHTHGQEGLSMCEGERSGAAEGIAQPGLGRTLHDGLSLWMDEPDIPRVGVGIPDRAKRLKAIGNAIVPQVAYEIIRHMKP